jgi:hypothetical protein
MPVPKQMKQEELRQVMAAHIAPIRAAQTALTELIAMYSRSSDFTFSELEGTNKVLEMLDGTKTALKEIKAAMAIRARTRVAEACK